MDWANVYSQERLTSLTNEMNDLMADLQEYYGHTQRELKPNIKPKYKRHY